MQSNFARIVSISYKQIPIYESCSTGGTNHESAPGGDGDHGGDGPCMEIFIFIHIPQLKKLFV